MHILYIVSYQSNCLIQISLIYVLYFVFVYLHVDCHYTLFCKVFVYLHLDCHYTLFCNVFVYLHVDCHYTLFCNVFVYLHDDSHYTLFCNVICHYISVFTYCINWYTYLTTTFLNVISSSYKCWHAFCLWTKNREIIDDSCLKKNVLSVL